MDAIGSIVNSLIGPALVIAGLLLTMRHFKLARTVSYIERFNDPGMIQTRAKVDDWLQSSDSNDERIRQANSDAVLRTEIMTFMNLFIEVGIAYRYRLLNRRVAFDIWSQLVPEYWNKLVFYVEYNRTHGRNIGQSFEFLAKEMKRAQNNQNHEAKSADAKPHVEV